MARRKKAAEGEDFLWLMSLSDLMILLFILFVVLYSFAYKKLKSQDFSKIAAAFLNKEYKDPVDKVQTDVTEWVKKNNLESQISVTKEGEELKMEIRDKLIFNSGEFTLVAEGGRTLASLAESLVKIPPPYRLGIEGHTDDIPIHTKKISDNWDLSGRRALAVFNALKLPESMHDRTVLMAHGPSQPIAPNRTEDGTPIPENQVKNRRVTLRIF